MTRPFLYWLCMFLWLIGGVGLGYYRTRDWSDLPGSILLFIMFLLIGLALFGQPIK